jgi:hypothetical protein
MAFSPRDLAAGHDAHHAATRIWCRPATPNGGCTTSQRTWASELGRRMAGQTRVKSRPFQTQSLRMTVVGPQSSAGRCRAVHRF